MLCKPFRLSGTSSALGAGVHPDDKELVKKFISLGVGKEYNEEFEMQITKTSPSTTSIAYTTLRNDGLSLVPSIISSLSSTLLKIDLSNNCLTVLPDDFFKLKNLTHINLRRNLLVRL
jgi:Leucine-rich repeat (LRR) protein